MHLQDQRLPQQVKQPASQALNLNKHFLDEPPVRLFDLLTVSEVCESPDMTLIKEPLVKIFKYFMYTQKDENLDIVFIKEVFVEIKSLIGGL
jgi:hypothetical protein